MSANTIAMNSKSSFTIGTTDVVVGKAKDGKHAAKPSDKPGGFAAGDAARKSSTNARTYESDEVRYKKSHEKGVCFRICLGMRLKDHIRGLFGLVTDHDKHQTKRASTQVANHAIMAELRKQSDGNNMSYCLFAMHCAAKVLNHTIVLEITNLMRTTYGMTDMEIVEARYGVNADNPAGVNLLNCALWSMSYDCIRLCVSNGSDLEFVNSYGESCDQVLRLGLEHANKVKPESKQMHYARYEQCTDFIRESREFNLQLLAKATLEEMSPSTQDNAYLTPPHSAAKATPPPIERKKAKEVASDDGFTATATIFSAPKKEAKKANAKTNVVLSKFNALCMDSDSEDEGDKSDDESNKSDEKTFTQTIANHNSASAFTTPDGKAKHGKAKHEKAKKQDVPKPTKQMATSWADMEDEDPMPGSRDLNSEMDQEAATAFVTPVKKVKEQVAPGAPVKRESIPKSSVSGFGKVLYKEAVAETPAKQPIKTKEPDAPRKLTLKEKKRLKKLKNAKNVKEDIALAPIPCSLDCVLEAEEHAMEEHAAEQTTIYAYDDEGTSFMEDVVEAIFVMNDDKTKEQIWEYINNVKSQMCPELLVEFMETVSSIMD